MAGYQSKSEGIEKIKGLIAWCKECTKDYSNVNVTNMTSAWRNGLAFCAIIHHFHPDLIPFSTLKAEDILENNRLAFSIAEEEFGIPALLDPEDMVAMAIPDRLCVITYVSQIHAHFKSRVEFGNFREAEGLGRYWRDKAGLKRPCALPYLPVPSPKKRGTLEENCAICKKKVYIMERILVESSLFHRCCYKDSLKKEIFADETDKSLERQSDQTPRDSSKEKTNRPIPSVRASKMEINHETNQENFEKLQPKFGAEDIQIEMLHKKSNLKLANKDIVKVEFEKPSLKNTQLKKKSNENSELTSKIVKKGTLERKEKPTLMVKPLIKPQLTSQRQTHFARFDVGGNVEVISADSTSNELLKPDKKSTFEINANRESIPQPSTSIVPPPKQPQYIGQKINAKLASLHVEDRLEDSIEKKNSISSDPPSDIKGNGESLEKDPEFAKKNDNAFTQATVSINCSTTDKHCKASTALTKPIDYIENSEPRQSLHLNIPSSFQSQTNEEKLSPSNPFFEEEDESYDIDSLTPTNPFSSGFDERESTAADLCTPPLKPPRVLLSPENDEISRDYKHEEPEPIKKVLTVEPCLLDDLKVPLYTKHRGSEISLASIEVSSQNSSLNFLADLDSSPMKKNKRKAPPPPPEFDRRVIRSSSKTIALEEIEAQLASIDEEQQELEEKGVVLEQKLRGGEECEVEEEMEVVWSEWFDLVNRKNELFRQEMALYHTRRMQELEDKHSEVEREIRILSNIPQDKKSMKDLAREEELIQELVAIVNERNKVVDIVEIDRQREIAEDESIQQMKERRLTLTLVQPTEESTKKSKDDRKREKKEKKRAEKEKRKEEKKMKQKQREESGKIGLAMTLKKTFLAEKS